MNGIIEFLLITIVTFMIGGVLALVFKVLEHWLSAYFQLSFYYSFLSFTILLYTLPFAYILFWLCYHIMNHSTIRLFGIATTGVTIVFLVIAVVWMVGVIVHFIMQRDVIGRLSRIYKSRTLAPHYYREILDELCKEMGIRRHISMYRSYHSNIIFITGLFKPAIYLPMDKIDASALRMILMHELRHYKQGDNLLKPISAMLRLVFWFWSPYTYIADNYSIYAEANNDNYCINRLGDGKKYFNLLLEFSDVECGSKNTITTAWVEESDGIVRRLMLVNKYRKEKMRLSVVALFVAFTLTVSGVTAYGAANTLKFGYNQLWSGTMSGQAEVLQEAADSGLVEYEGSVADFEGMTEVGDNQQGIAPFLSSNIISCQLMNMCYYRSPIFKLSAGDSVYVSVGVQPSNKEVTVGIVKPDGKTIYVRGKGNFSHTFTTNKTGDHQVFISNYSGTKVTITGFYN